VPDYEEMLDQMLGTDRLVVRSTDPVPTQILTRLTPSRLTGVDLDADEAGPDSGIYVGDADNPEDVINFWNIRAAGAGLVFYDPGMPRGWRHFSTLTGAGSHPCPQDLGRTMA
jgi:hypothetical protein